MSDRCLLGYFFLFAKTLPIGGPVCFDTHSDAQMLDTFSKKMADVIVASELTV